MELPSLGLGQMKIHWLEQLLVELKSMQWKSGESTSTSTKLTLMVQWSTTLQGIIEISWWPYLVLESDFIPPPLISAFSFNKIKSVKLGCIRTKTLLFTLWFIWFDGMCINLTNSIALYLIQTMFKTFTNQSTREKDINQTILIVKSKL